MAVSNLERDAFEAGRNFVNAEKYIVSSADELRKITFNLVAYGSDLVISDVEKEIRAVRIGRLYLAGRGILEKYHPEELPHLNHLRTNFISTYRRLKAQVEELKHAR